MNIKKFEKLFKTHINLNIDLSKNTLSSFNKVFEIIDFLIKKIKNNKKIFVYGNGGSYADASHFVSELTATYKKKNRKGLPFYLLSSNLSSLTAWSNDIDFKSYLHREVQSLINKDDVLILISTSGGNKKSKQSINLLNAAKLAKKNKIRIIGFLGNNGGDLKKYCNYNLIIPSKDTARIQECHIFFGHVLMDIVERDFL